MYRYALMQYTMQVASVLIHVVLLRFIGGNNESKSEGRIEKKSQMECYCLYCNVSNSQYLFLIIYQNIGLFLSLPVFHNIPLNYKHH